MKCIIIYATRYGCAEEAAKRLQKQLDGECRLVNIMSESVPPLKNFDTVILGGSVYIGRVQKQLSSYIGDNLNILLDKKIGLYICAGAPKQEQLKGEFENAYPHDLLEHAAAKAVLGYAFLFEKMKFFDKLIMKKIKGDAVSVSEYYDDRIIQFAEALSAN